MSPKCFEREALVRRSLADADPGDVALADVLDAARAVDEVVDLALEHRLEVLLHLAAGHLDQDAHVDRRPVRQVLEARPDHLDLAVLDLVHVDHAQVLEGPAVLAAELDAHVLLAHHFALERRAVGHRDRDFGHLDLDAARLDALLDQLLGALQVVLALDLVEGHGDDVLVGGDAGRQDLRDAGVGDDREAVVDGARGRRVLQVVDLAQGEHEGEDALPVVEQDVLRLAALHAAEGQGRAGGEAHRVDGREGVGPNGTMYVS